MSSQSPKHAIFDCFAEVAKALGHGRRLEILELLAQSERNVEALADTAGLSIANTSQHLRLMRQAGLLVSRRAGKHVFYRLSDPSVLEVLASLRRVAENNMAEVSNLVRTYFDQRDALEPISRKELIRRLKDDIVTVLDVRPSGEFSAGHVAGAINIPLRELKKRLGEIPKGREVVAYCRGPYCVLAFEAVAALRAKGFKAVRLEDGFPEWKAAGLNVEVRTAE